MIEKIHDKPWEELNEEIEKLSKEYARLKNRPRPFETEIEKQARVDQFKKDKHEKWKEFDSFGTDFEKKRDYVLARAILNFNPRPKPTHII